MNHAEHLNQHIEPIIEYMLEHGFTSIQICAAGCVHMKRTVPDEAAAIEFGDKSIGLLQGMNPEMARNAFLTGIMKLPEDSFCVFDRWLKLEFARQVAGADADDLDPVADKFGGMMKAAGVTNDDIEQLRKKHATGRK